MPARRTLIAVAALTLTMTPSIAYAQQPDCLAYLAWPAPVGQARDVTAKDLVGLRDLGSNDDSLQGAGPIALAPDQRRIVFQLRRADPISNSYCLGMYVINIRDQDQPILIDHGGDLIRVHYDFRGKAHFATGIAETITPQWTPDGKSVLFLKRTNGNTQVWLAQADGSGSHPITDSPDDVVDFRIVDNGRSIVFRTQPQLRLGLEQIDAEARRGFHYDDRYSPMTSDRPFVPGPLPYESFLQRISAAGAARALELPDESQGMGHGASQQPAAVVRSPSGDEARLVTQRGQFPPGAVLSVRLKNGKKWICTASACDRDVLQMWWTADGRLRFLHREGWGREATAIYEWRPGLPKPRRLFSTRDLLLGCRPVPTGIICAQESSTRPRYIAQIELPSGHETVLFDPNPEFQRIRLGKAERLHWKNQQGLEVFGDLVLPINYRKGHLYPLIVVQYQSRGFLRGGTGDEYPIQLFAAHGYAVLSFNRPAHIGLFTGARTLEEAGKADLKDFADRRSVLSALEAGIRLLVARHIVDPDRIGITGLSDGASTVEFALVNSHLFKAAAMSSCCWDASIPISVGPGAARHFAAEGYPGVTSEHEPFWRSISLVSNAERIRTPILLQLADTEYLSALTSYTALREQRAPVDLYVFPGETHVKWQPAHRLAVYRRSLAWFDFWLKNEDPESAEERRRWNGLRDDVRRPKTLAVANGQSRLLH